MVIRLEPNDRKQLIDLLINVPELETSRGCKQILNNANLENFIPRIDFSGSTFMIVSEIIDILFKQGQVSNHETALGLFLITVKEYTGLKQQAFLHRLLVKYQLMPSAALSPDIPPLGNGNQEQKILLLAAIPHSLRLDQEIREIEEAIRRSVRRELFQIKITTAVRPQDIRRVIEEERPQIVHFCGHGMEDGSLLLEDNIGNNKPVSSEALTSLFKLHAGSVKCVLLNACYSAKAAGEISQYIDYVIGMNKPIEDKAAIAFAQGFYDGLGYATFDNQDAINRAFQEGMVAIIMEDKNLSQGLIPVLRKKLDKIE